MQMVVVHLDVGAAGASCERIPVVPFCPYYHLENREKKKYLTNTNLERRLSSDGWMAITKMNFNKTQESGREAR